MSVDISWEADLGRPGDVQDVTVESAVQAALAHGEEGGRWVSVAFVSDPTLAELHGQFLDDPTPTDVMSFELGEDDGPWGEVVVSVDRANAVAAELELDPRRELLLYVIHGTLHLCGYDDHEDVDRNAMRRAEAQVLAELGLSDARDARH